MLGVEINLATDFGISIDESPREMVAEIDEHLKSLVGGFPVLGVYQLMDKARITFIIWEYAEAIHGQPDIEAVTAVVYLRQIAFGKHSDCILVALGQRFAAVLHWDLQYDESLIQLVELRFWLVAECFKKLLHFPLGSR